MQYEVFNGVNAFLIEMSKKLLRNGVLRKTRSYTCYELPYPVVIKIENPSLRCVTIPARKWNPILPFIESLWLASGRNDMEMVGKYVKKLFDFSDDVISMRAGYGPRLRFFNGISEDYKISFGGYRPPITALRTAEVDQFSFVEKCFNKDPYTRQAVISIGDPAKDCFDIDHNLKMTKDFPCSRMIQFIRNNDQLDMIVHMRSNDFVWGAGGVNIFNFTFMQEYFSQILGLTLGSYYHVANNFHYYEDKKQMVEELASSDLPKDEPFIYNRSILSLSDFDQKLKCLEEFEKKIRNGERVLLPKLNDDFFDDWAKVIFIANNVKQLSAIEFKNPLIEGIFRKSISPSTTKFRKDQIDEANVEIRSDYSKIINN